MLKKVSLIAAFVAMPLAGAAFAADVAKGEKEFGKCKTCHMIVAPDGTEIVKGNKTGPNLYGVVGRPVASYEGFDYGDSIKAAGALGLVWDEAMIAEYVKDPKKWLEANSGTEKPKTKMTFKLAKGSEDVAAYLASVAPAAAPAADPAAAPAEPAANP